MTKEYLRFYRQIEQELELIEETLAEVNATLYTTHTASMDGMPKGTPVEGANPADGLIDKKTKLATLYEEKRLRLADTLLEIENAIESLEPRERTLLRLHYIKGLTWENVCVEMGYSWRQIHRIHAKALERLRDA